MNSQSIIMDIYISVKIYYGSIIWSQFYFYFTFWTVTPFVFTLPGGLSTAFRASAHLFPSHGRTAERRPRDREMAFSCYSRCVFLGWKMLKDYPLVIWHIENHHAINGKINYFYGPFSMSQTVRLPGWVCSKSSWEFIDISVTRRSHSLVAQAWVTIGFDKII